MQIDTSWGSTKKSLVGLVAFLLVLTVFYVFEASGLLGFVSAVVAWYLAYLAVDKLAATKK